MAGLSSHVILEMQEILQEFGGFKARAAHKQCADGSHWNVYEKGCVEIDARTKAAAEKAKTSTAAAKSPESHRDASHDNFDAHRQAQKGGFTQLAKQFQRQARTHIRAAKPEPEKEAGEKKRRGRKPKMAD